MSYQLLQGDCLDVLPTLPAGSVQCCVTSPPYFGLRDYQTAQWEGGDPECDHSPGGQKRVGKTTLRGSTTTQGHQQEPYKNHCPKCGATRIDQQIGTEETPVAYVANLVTVFREVWRVLADDGVLWLNLGDSYNGSGGAGGDYGKGGLKEGQPKYPGRRIDGLKPKDLIGIPWRAAFALQDDGWYLRSDVIWHKLNPMPESVTDRPTKAHEYMFLLTKQAKYYYDADAIREAQSANSHGGQLQKFVNGNGRKREQLQSVKTSTLGGVASDYSPFGRNKRSVWSIPSQPYSGAHFATMPPDLVAPCILAGSRPGDTVLDPFSGSGTTGEVALRYSRRYVGIELNPDYIQLAHKRIAPYAAQMQLFQEPAHAAV